MDSSVTGKSRRIRHRAFDLLQWSLYALCCWED